MMNNSIQLIKIMIHSKKIFTSHFSLHKIGGKNYRNAFISGLAVMSLNYDRSNLQ